MTETADPTTSRVTQAMEDYLKAVYRLQEKGGAATTQALSEELNVTGPSVTNMVKRLHEMRLLMYTRYQGVELTLAGEKIALEVIRHHRLLELYLAETLGYSWDEVHDEAEKLEHHVSDDLEARMDSVLGFPTHDPHGDPIPNREGKMAQLDAMMLREAVLQDEMTVSRVSDRDPEQLRYLGTLGLFPGAGVVVLERLPFDDILKISVSGQEHIIGKHLGEAVFVVARSPE
ncbi:metal-dependent transcriptional regulator [soil metagenome]